MSNSHKFTNLQVADELKEVLAAMEVKDFNKFRVRAYQNVISVIESLSMSVFNMWENKRLGEIPGVGTTLEDHLDELFRTGKVAEFDVIKKELIKKHLEAGKNIKTFNENAIFRKLEEQDIDLIRVLVDATKDIGYPKYVVRRPQVQICVKTTKVIVDNILIKQGKRVSL